MSVKSSSTTGRLALPGVVALGLVSASVLVPTVAQAADGVSSSYNVGCTIYPDDDSGSSTDPAGVAFDGGRNDVTASPSAHRITASSLSENSLTA